jgi:hypothetical protein
VHHLASRFTCRALPAAILAAFSSPTGAVVPPGTITVTTLADSGAGSLRAAIAAAATGDTIVFDCGTSFACPTTITLSTQGNNGGFPGPTAFSISGKSITIDGAGGITLASQHGNTSGSSLRLFFVDTGAALDLRNVTLTGALAQGGNGGGSQNGFGGGGAAGLGGAIFNQGALTLSGVSIANSVAKGGNGGPSYCTEAQYGCVFAYERGGGGGGLGGDAPYAGAFSGGGAGTGGNGNVGNSEAGGSGGAGFGGSGGGLGGTAGTPDGTAGSNGGGGGGAFSGFHLGGDGSEGAGGGGGSVSNNGGNYFPGGGGKGGFGGGGGGMAGPSGRGVGGFGGGGGGGIPVFGAYGGWGGGDGQGFYQGNGGGGGAMGGAIFNRTGATLSFGSGSGSISGNSVVKGYSQYNGYAFGSGLFLHSDISSGLGTGATGAAFNLANGTLTIADTITSDCAEDATIQQPKPQLPACSDGGITINSGTLVLSGGDGFNGPTTINGGTLRVDGALTRSATTVKSGGTLAGTGTVQAVAANDGGFLAPGDSPGTLHAASFTWDGGAVLEFELGATSSASDSDQLALTGALTKGAAGAWKFAFSDGNGAPTLNTTYTLITFSGATSFVAGDFSYDYTGTNPALVGSFAIVDTGPNTHAVQFTATALPVRLQSFEVD